MGRRRSALAATFLLAAAAACALESAGPPDPSVAAVGVETRPVAAPVPLLRAPPAVTAGERGGGRIGEGSPVREAESQPRGADDLAPPAPDPARPVEVRVLDPWGAPVPGASLEVPGQPATATGADGRAWLGPWGFDMGSPRQDRHWKTVVVRAPGYVPVAHVGGGRREVIRLLERGEPVAGRLVDAEGRRAAGVEVALVWWCAGRAVACRTTTGAHGEFAFDAAPPTYVRVEACGGSELATSQEVVPPDLDVQVVLGRSLAPLRYEGRSCRMPDVPPPPPEGPPERGAPVRVRLLDARGGAVEDGCLIARCADSASGGAVASDDPCGRGGAPNEPRDEGVRLLGDVPPGTFELVWRSATSGRELALLRGFRMPEPAVPLDLGEVRLPALSLVDVQVSDAAGPVAGAVVVWRSPSGLDLVRADRDGRCRVPVGDTTRGVVSASDPRRGSARVVLGGGWCPDRLALVLVPASEDPATSR